MLKKKGNQRVQHCSPNKPYMFKMFKNNLLHLQSWSNLSLVLSPGQVRPEACFLFFLFILNILIQSGGKAIIIAKVVYICFTLLLWPIWTVYFVIMSCSGCSCYSWLV